MRSFTVATPDGVSIAASEWGNPDGPEVLFIHGFSQCSLAWMRQLNDPALAAKFRMVAYDLRGHGASGKPPEAHHYSQDRPWADEVASVIAVAGLKRPVLVAWSFAGRVVSDYLRYHGSSLLAGITFVGSGTKSAKEIDGPGCSQLSGMVSEDLAVNIAATRKFLRACFLVQPDRDTFETMLAYNMMIPARIRAAALDRIPNPGDLLPSLKLPVLVTHGSHDELVLPLAGEFTATTVPGARLSLYQDIGHTPFFEDTPRFNRELAEFVRHCNA